MQSFIALPFSSVEEHDRHIAEVIERTINKTLLSQGTKAAATTEERYMSRKEVAQLCGGVTEQTVSNWHTQKILRGKKVGSRLLFKREDVLKALDNLR
jgi:AraC-like DNA-binding protein